MLYSSETKTLTWNIFKYRSSHGSSAGRLLLLGTGNMVWVRSAHHDDECGW